jgi:hypothetical protein
MSLVLFAYEVVTSFLCVFSCLLECVVYFLSCGLFFFCYSVPGFNVDNVCVSCEVGTVFVNTDTLI